VNALGPTWPVKTVSAPNRATVLSRLNARTLRGVEVLRVVVSGKLAGSVFHQYKMLGAADRGSTGLSKLAPSDDIAIFII